jgi:hypothetical protein
LVVNPERERHLEGVGVDERIIFKTVFEKIRI